MPLRQFRSIPLLGVSVHVERCGHHPSFHVSGADYAYHDDILPREEIFVAHGGVFFLSNGDGTGSVTWSGIFIVLLSALGYALYLVTVSQLKNLEMKGLKMTFYVFLFGGILLFTGTEISGIGLQAIPDRTTLGNLVMLALVPTVISNLALVRAIKNIGSTLTSVLGAMEPVTAVCVGIAIFGEPFTRSIALGILLIISAVTVIILKR